MNILIILVPLAMALGGGFVFAFLWAVDNGQFEDTDTPAYRILNNNDPERTKHDERDHSLR